jgi:hypothetical protein
LDNEMARKVDFWLQFLDMTEFRWPIYSPVWTCPMWRDILQSYKNLLMNSWHQIRLCMLNLLTEALNS